MEDNLFIQAMNPQEVERINETKLNKSFTLRLISDLSRVFQTNHQVEDDRNCTIIRTKEAPNYNWYNCFTFTANADGISFNAIILTYEKRIIHIFNKYKDNENTSKDRDDDFANYTVCIKIYRDDVNLSEKLKDIVELMNLKGYRKNF